jgi:hypothetical protein
MHFHVQEADNRLRDLPVDCQAVPATAVTADETFPRRKLLDDFFAVWLACLHEAEMAGTRYFAINRGRLWQIAGDIFRISCAAVERMAMATTRK